MKKILYIALVYCGLANAQIVNIPDTNFKNRLLSASSSNSIAKNENGDNITIDLNGDGEIQVSEAVSVYQLQVTNSSIQDLTGIEAFVNLTILHCFSNNLTTLDFSNNLNLSYLRCESNLLTELNISNNSNLESLNCRSNNLTELNVSNNENLVILNCSFNSLTNLDISNNIGLSNLHCFDNELTELDVSNNINLLELFCGGNLLTELDVSENVNLIFLWCSMNSLTELDITNNINLTDLECHTNDLTELDVSNNSNLIHLTCHNNNFTELDLSNNSALEELWASSNPQLAYINIKNGGNLNPEAANWLGMWSNLPDNLYICADVEEAANIFPLLNQSGATGQTIATYCFIPGAKYNTVTGTVFYSIDGICNEEDTVPFLLKVNINDTAEQGYSFTNNEGNYLFFTQEGEFTLTPEIENATFFNVTPITETVSFPDNNNNEEIVNFCISPNGEYNDLEVVIAPINPARPGFEATYKIVYRNKGNQIMSDGLNFVFNQNLMTFVSASVEPDSQGSGSLNWSYENLMPFESRSIIVTMQINPPTHPTYPVNIDDVLTFTSLILPSDGDENTEDNLYVLNQTVVGSYDPNDITCIEGDVLNPDYIGEELHYLIRFENTGNYYAENVVIAMEIDEELYDVSSLRVLDASHDVRAQVRENVAEFFFNQIMLDSGGHGNILLVMKSMTALEEGDAVQSKADIYFDYNYPIITNDAVTLFQEELSRDNHELAALISIYPNPASDRVTISSETKIKSVEWYDLSGRLIRISLVNDFQSIQDISSQSEGIYIMKIQTEKGILYQKIIKK